MKRLKTADQTALLVLIVTLIGYCMMCVLPVPAKERKDCRVIHDPITQSCWVYCAPEPDVG